MTTEPSLVDERLLALWQVQKGVLRRVFRASFGAAGVLGVLFLASQLFFNWAEVATWFHANLFPPQVEKLNLNIGFTAWEEIKQQREETKDQGSAHAERHPLLGKKHKVKVDWNEKKFSGKIWLKGMGVDHRNDDKKWSFSIDLKKDRFILGMNKFAVHPPETRTWQSECLFQEALRLRNQIHARCQLVNVSINGNPIGLMTLTERLGDVLLENSERKPGILTEFHSLDRLIELRQRQRDALSGIEEEGIRVSKEGKSALKLAVARMKIIDPPHLKEQKEVFKNPSRKTQWRVAQKLLEGYLDGQLKASEVFDSRKAAEALAIVLLLGEGKGAHAFAPHNLHLFFNPISFLFEVVPVDLDSSLRRRASPLIIPNTVANIFTQGLLSDPAIRADVAKVLAAILQPTSNEAGFVARLAAHERKFLEVLHTEYPKIRNWDFSKIPSRAGEFLKQLDTGVFVAEDSTRRDKEVSFPSELNLMPLPSARLYEHGGKLRLKVLNALPVEFLVKGIEITRSRSNKRTIERIPLNLTLGSTFGAGHRRGVREVGSLDVALEIPTTLESVEIAVVELFNRQQDRSYTEAVIKHVGRFERHPLASMSLAEIIETHPFISVDEGRKIFSIPSGVWRIRSFLRLPEGYRLLVEPGTDITFSNEAGILVRGALAVRGTESRPVFLRGSDGKSWRGIAVMQANYWTPESRSRLSHVSVNNTDFTQHGDWSLTGAFSFYESDVDLLSTTFSQTQAEDALNIIHSDFSFDRVLIENTRSDAFDGDFASGKITNSEFRMVGGDGIDFSGSKIDVRDSKFSQIHDKAVSVGESSILRGERLTITDSGTGIVSKDGSSVEVEQTAFSDIQFFPIMTYVKKPQYGPAHLVASNTSVATRGEIGLNQKGSKLIINGQSIVGRKVDVDALYKGYMKK